MATLHTLLRIPGKSFFYHFRSAIMEYQFPRILSATVRENILFSHEYDETFYNLVIEGNAISLCLLFLY